MMDAQVWMTGNVGTEVEYRHISNDVPYASFRLACTPRARKGNDWVDGETTWVRVTCYRALADHVKSSIGKGDPVLAAGRLRTTRWTDEGGVIQERLLLEASSVGHDLTRGTSVFRKAARPVVEDLSLAELVAEAEAMGEDGEEAEAEAGAA